MTWRRQDDSLLTADTIDDRWRWQVECERQVERLIYLFMTKIYSTDDQHRRSPSNGVERWSNVSDLFIYLFIAHLFIIMRAWSRFIYNIVDGDWRFTCSLFTCSRWLLWVVSVTIINYNDSYSLRLIYYLILFTFTWHLPVLRCSDDYLIWARHTSSICSCSLIRFHLLISLFSSPFTISFLLLHHDLFTFHDFFISHILLWRCVYRYSPSSIYHSSIVECLARWRWLFIAGQAHRRWR